MYDIRNIYERLPFAIYITDAYGYILETNNQNPFKQIKKGKRLSLVILDFPKDRQGQIEYNGKVYQWTVSEIKRNNNIAGFTILLIDITMEDDLAKKSRIKSCEIDELIENRKEANSQLESLALEVKQLSDYAEQLRIAKNIHDNSGHTLTAIHTICGMCNSIKERDREKYTALIEEGLELCKQEMTSKDIKSFDSVKSILEHFVYTSPFSIYYNIAGNEPDFIKEKYALIYKIVRESYHNTLSHSLAEKIEISVNMTDESIQFIIQDDGKFHGNFEKGFGLTVMEENVNASGGQVKFIHETGQGFGVNVIWRKE